MNKTVRDAARSLASIADFYKLPTQRREEEAAAALALFGEDDSDPLLVAMCVEEASKLHKRRSTSILGRIKEALTIYDRDFVEIMGDITRPTINAYIQGRLREVFDEKDRNNLKAMIDERIAKLEAIKAEL